MASQQHIVFLNLKSTGHMNPTLPVVAELAERNCKVTYFVDAAQQEVVEAAGARWHRFRCAHDPTVSGATGTSKLDDFGIKELVPPGTPEKEYSGMLNGLPYWTEQILPALIEDLRALTPTPTAIVYDPFLAAGPVAAKVLGIPAVSLFTMPGPGTFSKGDSINEALEAKPWVDRPRRAIAEKYGVDMFENGMVMEHFSSVDNITTTIDELFAAPSTKLQVERFGHFPFSCVGALMNPKVKRINNAYVQAPKAAEMEASGNSMEIQAPLPMERILQARQAGRKTLFISLGTVATGDSFWATPFGPFGLSNDLPGKPQEEGRRPLSEWTGKEFCQHIWRACFEAFGDDEAFQVILSVGPKQDALEGMPPVPANFLVRDAVPQLEVLPVCDAFITHGGANSMHEALGLGVPLAVVPIFADQPINADTIARSGSGISFRYPLSRTTAATLRHAISELIAPDGDQASPYKVAADAMAAKLKAAGGIHVAANIILKHSSQVMARMGGC